MHLDAYEPRGPKYYWLKNIIDYMTSITKDLCYYVSIVNTFTGCRKVGKKIEVLEYEVLWSYYV